MRPLVLMCLVSITAGVMNCLPWGGPCGRLAAGFNISATDILVAELPGMIIGLICCFLIALYYARQEKKRGAGLEAGADSADLFSEADKTEEEKALLRPQLFWFNVASDRDRHYCDVRVRTANLPLLHGSGSYCTDRKLSWH